MCGYGQGEKEYSWRPWQVGPFPAGIRTSQKEVAVAQGKRPDYRAFVSRQNGDKTYYTEVGAAWNVASDGISIKLHALPVGGELVLFPPKDDEK